MRRCAVSWSRCHLRLKDDIAKVFVHCKKRGIVLCGGLEFLSSLCVGLCLSLAELLLLLCTLFVLIVEIMYFDKFCNNECLWLYCFKEVPVASF